MKKQTIAKLSVLTALIAFSTISTANASQIIGSANGISAPAVTLTFNEVVLPDSTSLTNQYSAYGVTFSGLYYNPCSGCVVLPAKPDVGNFTGNNTSTYNSGFDIDFSSNVTGASFRFASNGGTFGFAAYNGATLVDSFSANGSAWGNYGFENLTFNRIHVSSPSALLIDNLSVTAVPEPETYAMLLAGLGVMGAVVRRRKAKQA